MGVILMFPHVPFGQVGSVVTFYSSGGVHAREGLPTFLGPAVSHMPKGKDLVGLIPQGGIIEYVSSELL